MADAHPEYHFQYKKNAYECEKCGRFLITIDRDHGTTPFMTTCQRDGCDGVARSKLYRFGQTFIPTHEWYEPDIAEYLTLDETTQEHVRTFGLILRPIEPYEDWRSKYGTHEEYKQRFDDA